MPVTEKEFEDIGDRILSSTFERLQKDGLISKEDAEWAQSHYVMSVRRGNTPLSRIRRIFEMGKEKNDNEFHYVITVANALPLRETKSITNETKLDL